MRSERDSKHHKIHHCIVNNLHALSRLREEQGFVSFFHTTSHDNVPITINFEKVAYSKVDIGRARGECLNQTLFLYGKEGKIYYDNLAKVLGDKAPDQPTLMPPAKYCFVIVKVSLQMGAKYEFRAKKAATGAHWQLVGEDERSEVVSAGEFFVNEQHELVFAYNKTGKYSNIPFENHRNWFITFFPKQYFSETNFHCFDTQEELNRILQMRQLLGLDQEYASAGTQGLFSGSDKKVVVLVEDISIENICRVL